MRERGREMERKRDKAKLRESNREGDIERERRAIERG